MSLSVAEHIKSRLSRSEPLKEKVGDRMFPVALSAETEFPFICYERASVVPGFEMLQMPGTATFGGSIKIIF